MNCSTYCALKFSLHSLHISPNGAAIAFALSILSFVRIYHSSGGFPGGSDDKEYACKGGDPGLSQEDSPGEGNGNSLQYCCLENSMILWVNLQPTP